MPALMDPVIADAEDQHAPLVESVPEPTVPGDPIPLESMTWPELKRVARQVGVKLNAKKPVIIERIREARATVDADECRRQSTRGRIEQIVGATRQRVRQANTALAAWWKQDGADAEPNSADAGNEKPGNRIVKIAIWGFGIAAGGVFGLLAALGN